jgi:hypothetical protein
MSSHLKAKHTARGGAFLRHPLQQRIMQRFHWKVPNRGRLELQGELFHFPDVDDFLYSILPPSSSVIVPRSFNHGITKFSQAPAAWRPVKNKVLRS